MPTFQGGDPGSPDRKQQHIQQAIVQTGMSGIDPSNVVLIDDDPTNVEKAQASGHRGILVPKEHNPRVDYLNEVNQIARLQVQYEQKNPFVKPIQEQMFSIENVKAVGKPTAFSDRQDSAYFVFNTEPQSLAAADYLNKTYGDGSVRVSSKGGLFGNNQPRY